MHFAILVVGKDVDVQLAKYDENIDDMPWHKVLTREQLIAYERDKIRLYNERTYSEYIKDKEAYKKKYKANPEHIDYLENDFPKRLQWTDEDCINEFIRYWDCCKSDGIRVLEDGSVETRWNENQMWDWYEIGGRYRGCLVLKEGAKPLRPLCKHYVDKREEYFKLLSENRCDQAYKKDIANWLDENFVFYGIIRNGDAIMRGKYGLFVSDWSDMESNEWEAKFRETLADVGDDEVITIVDCHD